ncbi:MAG: hypothetical protein PHV82_13640 [Victivallaceae bacterium]|nr:hypothetical protein [Victivallaceae bacterium]
MALWNRKISQIIIFFAGILSSGCDNNGMILEKKYIFNLKVIETRKGNDDYLVISGLCGHSAYGVKKIIYQKNKNKIIMLIEIALKRNGNFKEEILISKNISELLLGKEKSVIWKRNAKPTEQSSIAKPDLRSES